MKKPLRLGKSFLAKHSSDNSGASVLNYFTMKYEFKPASVDLDKHSASINLEKAPKVSAEFVGRKKGGGGDDSVEGSATFQGIAQNTTAGQECVLVLKKDTWYVESVSTVFTNMKVVKNTFLEVPKDEPKVDPVKEDPSQEEAHPGKAESKKLVSMESEDGEIDDEVQDKDNGPRMDNGKSNKSTVDLVKGKRKKREKVMDSENDDQRKNRMSDDDDQEMDTRKNKRSRPSKESQNNEQVRPKTNIVQGSRASAPKNQRSDIDDEHASDTNLENLQIKKTRKSQMEIREEEDDDDDIEPKKPPSKAKKRIADFAKKFRVDRNDDEDSESENAGSDDENESKTGSDEETKARPATAGKRIAAKTLHNPYAKKIESQNLGEDESSADETPQKPRRGTLVSATRKKVGSRKVASSSESESDSDVVIDDEEGDDDEEVEIEDEDADDSSGSYTDASSQDD